MSRPKPLDPRASLAAALGSRVRRLRTDRGWSQQELADRVYISATRIAQIELATDPPNEPLTQDLDRLLEADDELNVAWWHMNRHRHPSWVRPYMDLEQCATRMRYFGPQLVPGILQTAAYARALLQAGQLDVTEHSLQRQIEARMARRSLLQAADPLHLWVILDESFLFRPFGDGPATMHAQLDFLLSMSEMPHVELQVLPFKAGHHGLMDGPVSLMSFSEGPDVAYLEGAGPAGELVESPRTVKQYATIFDRLISKSLTPADSRELMRVTMEERFRCPPPPHRI